MAIMPGPGGGGAPAAPPHDARAEAAVIGSALLNPAAADEVAGVLRPEDFYRPAHAILWRAVLALREEGRPLDLVVLRDRLAAAGELDRVGGVSYLAEVADAVPTSANAAHYAEIVVEKAAKRRALAVGLALAHDAGNGKSADEAIRNATEALAQIAVGPKVPTDARSAALRSLADLQSAIEGTPAPPVSTGYESIDHHLSGGIRPGQILVLGARTSVGKSAWAYGFAARAIERADPGLFVTLETTTSEAIAGVVCNMAKVCLRDYVRGKLTETEVQRVVVAMETFAKNGECLEFEDRAGMTVGDVVARARAISVKKPLRWILVDYLNLLRPRVATRDLYTSTTMIANDLKAAAKVLMVPLIALAQINRAPLKRDDPRPTMGDLRDSGAIEQSADHIVLLHRPAASDPSAQQDVAEAIVAKSKMNGTGSIPMKWVSWCPRFEDLQPGGVE